jgi:hypothetical protein
LILNDLIHRGNRASVSLDLDPERLAVIFPNEGAATVDCPHAEFDKSFEF